MVKWLAPDMSLVWLAFECPCEPFDSDETNFFTFDHTGKASLEARKARKGSQMCYMVALVEEQSSLGLLSPWNA